MHLSIFIFFCYFEASNTQNISTEAISDDEENELVEDEFLPGFDEPLDLKPTTEGNPLGNLFCKDCLL